MISTRTILTGLHAVSGLSRLPHVLVAPVYMRFRACHNFRTYHFCRGTCAFRIVMISACTIPAACIRFSTCHNFCRYYFRGKTCAFQLVMISARTISAGVHAVSGLSRFPHVLFPREDMRFRAYHAFRMYYFCRGTCTFRLVTFSARTSHAGVHALFGLSQFPQVEFLPEYMRFHAYHAFRMYYPHWLACAFQLVTFSARISRAGLHALSGLSRLPHVLFLRACMRFRAYHAFRMYYFCQGTCAFALIPFSARTSHAGVHAISGLSQFPQVEFLPEYMRFLACHNFRTYYFCQCTCGFQLATISACTILTGLHAVSHLSRFSHILGTPDSASAGCNYLNCLNM